MKTLTKTLAICLLSTSLAHAAAGAGGGNGGDAIICRNGTFLLDYIEMKHRGMKLHLPGNTLREKVYRALNKVTSIDLIRYTSLKSTADVLLQDIEAREADANAPLPNIRFTDDVLADVDDSNEVSIPNGCKKEQLVIQSTPVFPVDRRFTVQSEIWDTMSVEQHALTVLHEAWYTVFLRDGARDSRFARYINSVFASDEVITREKYLSHLELSSRLGFAATIKESFKDTTNLFSPSSYTALQFEGQTFYRQASINPTRFPTAFRNRRGYTYHGLYLITAMAYNDDGSPLFVGCSDFDHATNLYFASEDIMVASSEYTRDNCGKPAHWNRSATTGEENFRGAVHVFMNAAGDVQRIYGPTYYLKIGKKVWSSRNIMFIDARKVNGEWIVNTRG